MLAGFTSQLMQMPFQEVYQRPMPICASPSPPCEDRLSHGNIPTLRGATCKIMTCKTNARGEVLELQWRSRSGKACGGGRRGVKCRPRTESGRGIGTLGMSLLATRCLKRQYTYSNGTMQQQAAGSAHFPQPCLLLLHHGSVEAWGFEAWSLELGQCCVPSYPQVA
jgi:hypothetical protein